MTLVHFRLSTDYRIRIKWPASYPAFRYLASSRISASNTRSNNYAFLILISFLSFFSFLSYPAQRGLRSTMQHSQLAPLPNNVPFRIVSKTIGQGAYAW